MASDDHGFAFERGIEEFFHRDEEGVHIDVKDGFAGSGIGGQQQILDDLSANVFVFFSLGGSYR